MESSVRVDGEWAWNREGWAGSGKVGHIEFQERNQGLS